MPSASGHSEGKLIGHIITTPYTALWKYEQREWESERETGRQRKKKWERICNSDSSACTSFLLWWGGAFMTLHLYSISISRWGDWQQVGTWTNYIWAVWFDECPSLIGLAWRGMSCPQVSQGMRPNILRREKTHERTLPVSASSLKLYLLALLSPPSPRQPYIHWQLWSNYNDCRVTDSRRSFMLHSPRLALKLHTACTKSAEEWVEYSVRDIAQQHFIMCVLWLSTASCLLQHEHTGLHKQSFVHCTQTAGL